MMNMNGCLLIIINALILSRWCVIPLSIIVFLIYYIIRLRATEKKLKSLNRVNDVIWNNSQGYMFLIDKNRHVRRTNFYTRNNLIPPKGEKCLGEVMECKYALENDGCGNHQFCQTCPIRQKMTQTYINKDSFKNLELIMDLRLPSNQLGLYNVMISGTYLTMEDEDFLLINIHDISREKALERSVRKSNEKFLSVFNNLPVGTAICDVEGNIREVNDAYLDYIGIDSKDLIIGKLNIYDNPCINQEFKDMMHRGIPVADEVKYDYEIINEQYIKSRHSSTKYYRFIVNYLRGSRGNIEYIVMIWVDNTFIHKTLRQNKSFQDMITFASSVSNIGFSSVNLLKNERLATPEYLKNMGENIADDVTTGLSGFEKVHPEDREILVRHINKARFQKVELLEKEVRVMIGGSYHWIKQLIMQQTFEPEMGNIVLLGVNMDINQQKKSEEELKLAKEKAESSDKLKSAFLANMSHEIRTPLNAIVGFSELLANASNEIEKNNYKDIIRHNNDLLLQLISDILDLSKIEADTLEFNYSDVDLNALLRDLEQTTRFKASGKTNIEINFEPELPVCIIHTERTRISQVFNNFLTNALKFTENGSIILGYKSEPESIYFYVKDTGCGISEEKLPLVFHRFVKLNNFKQGTGLGLAISQSIVNKLGGEIGVDSIEGEGSTFWFRLPVKPLEMKTGIEEKSIEDDLFFHQANETDEVETIREREKKTILIAEDAVDNYHLYEIILGKNYNLIHAWDGQEAIELYIKHSPDVILMDIRMPNWNGYEATQAIRQLSAEIPIIAVTAFAYSEDKTRILSNGFNGYLTKPVKSKELLDMLAKFNL